MSRYTLKKDGRTMAYGFDRPLSQYFYTIYGKDDDDIIEDSHPIKGASRGELMEKLTEWGAPEEHKSAVALDLPF